MSDGDDLGLPKPPPGSRWEVAGIPRSPWVWSSGVRWVEDRNGRAVAAEPWAVASAAEASAIWVGGVR